MPVEPQVITGQDQYFHMVAESTWGEMPGAPVYVPIPFAEYNVKLNRQRRNNAAHFGEYGTKHGATFRGQPEGGFRIPCHSYHPTALGTAKSLGQYFIEWGFGDPDARYLRSRSVEHAQGPNLANKRHRGLRINQMTISGTDESGFIDLAGDVIGYTEESVATAQAFSNTHHGLHDCHFSSTIFTVNSVVVPISAFTLTRTHGLKTRYRGAARPLLLARTIRKTMLSFVLDKESNAYDEAARLIATETRFDIQLQFQGLNGGTGPGGTNYTRFLFDMPSCDFIQPDDSDGLEEIMGTTVNCEVLEPDGSDRDLTITYSSPV